MKLLINNFLEKYYTEDEPIILACSTGPDSMFILYEILKTKYAKNLVACYFNHKLRTESDLEEAFIEELGKKHNFKVEIADAKIKEIRDTFYPSLGLEEVAREKRYAFLNAVLNIYNTDKIITGHHLDDKIETFFFNLARGTKLTGLINMTEKSGALLRPLINLEKNEILRYLDENNLEYKIDKTNFDTDITRNKLRHDIIPQFEKINGNYKKNISNLISYFEEIKEFLDKEVKDFLDEQGILIFNSGKYKINTLSINGYFYIDDFNKNSSLLQKEIIRHIYYISNNKSTIGLSEANIIEVIRFINGKNNKTVKEIKDMKLEKNNKIIIF
ncbi:MAG: tRNA lysidine(34) synthetase TilS [Candidatus Gracilibacteria bacterium]|nr:tRNA lysidine(34) synthetase TilS [Candidatus Gracilibacteria bacterium]